MNIKRIEELINKIFEKKLELSYKNVNCTLIAIIEGKEFNIIKNNLFFDNEIFSFKITIDDKMKIKIGKQGFEMSTESEYFKFKYL